MILLTDTGGDGLPDGEEMEWLTNPSDSDSDDDGVSDGSGARAVAEGFHPAVFDPRTPEEWASEFAKGVAIGDAGACYLSPCPAGGAAHARQHAAGTQPRALDEVIGKSFTGSGDDVGEAARGVIVRVPIAFGVRQ